jgi:hypothetical protein
MDPGRDDLMFIFTELAFNYLFIHDFPTMKQLLRISLYLPALLLFTSCRTASLTSSWTNDTYTAQSYNKVLVVAIASKTSNRAAIEGAVVDELKKQAIHAVSSLSVFPGSQNAFSEPQAKISKEELAQQLKDHQIDGLIVLSLLDKKVEEVYVEGKTYTQTQTINQGIYSEPVYNHPGYNQDPNINYHYNYHPNGYNDRYDQYYTDYYTYYDQVQTTVTEPGYYENQTTLYLESNFYRVDDAMLVWSGQSEVVDASSVASGAIDWAVVLVKGMIKYKAIVP